jgi:hypothetical protein
MADRVRPIGLLGDRPRHNVPGALGVRLTDRVDNDKREL